MHHQSLKSCSIPMFKMMSSLPQFILLIAIIHQSQCEEKFWQKSKIKNWDPKDALTCYTTVTLELFENLKKVVDVSYVNAGEAEFKSKFDPNLDFFPVFNDSIESISIRFKKKIDEMEIAAIKGLAGIRKSLECHCSQEKQTELMEITKIFKEMKAKCFGAMFYLHNSIWWLERTCQEKEKAEFESEKRYSRTAWKNGSKGLKYL